MVPHPDIMDNIENNMLVQNLYPIHCCGHVVVCGKYLHGWSHCIWHASVLHPLTQHLAHAFVGPSLLTQRFNLLTAGHGPVAKKVSVAATSHPVKSTVNSSFPDGRLTTF